VHFQSSNGWFFAVVEAKYSSLDHFAGSPHDEDQRIRTPAIWQRKRAEGFPAGN